MSAAFVPIVRMGVLSGFLVTMVMGSLMALNKEITAGEFAMLLFLTQRFLWPFTSLGEIVDLFERSMASTKRILDTLDFRATIKDGSNKEFSRFDDSIAFNSIQFYYDKNNIVFDDIGFVVQKKKITAIVGPTGIGKTSLVKLLLRFYDPQKGDILIDKQITESPYPPIDPRQASFNLDLFPGAKVKTVGLTKTQKQLLNQRKGMLPALGIQGILDTIKENFFLKCIFKR